MRTKLMIVVLIMTSLTMIPTYGQSDEAPDPNGNNQGQSAQETTKPNLKTLDKFYDWIINEKTEKAMKDQNDIEESDKPETKEDQYRKALVEINAQTKVQKKYLSQIVNPFGQNFMVTTGAILLNPYTISQNEDGSYELKGDSETETEFFIEMIARHRPAWMKKARQEKLENKWQYIVPTDLEGRIGFVTETKEVTGSTVAGSGEGFIEASVGWQLYSQSPTTSLNLETMFSMVTDREFQDIHDSYHAGFCYIAGIPVPNKTEQKNSDKTASETAAESIDTRRVIEFALGAYYCGVEVPRFADEETNLLVSNRGEPEFYTAKGAMIRGDINIPFDKSGSLCLVTRYYLGTEDINPWSLRLGVTINVQAMLGLFSFNSTD